MDILPRWAYHDEEWLDIKLLADKVIDGIMYRYKEIDKNDIEEIRKLNTLINEIMF